MMSLINSLIRGRFFRIGTTLCSLILFSFIVSPVVAAPRFPFPTNDSYPFGIIASNASAEQVQQKFTAWKDEFYEEEGELARIKWDTPEQTVSEGIAYGMLIMAFMDNRTNDTRDEFDKLWAYYKKYMNDNGVMNWKINGFAQVVEYGGATDAELDAAVALLMAYKQWDDESYLNDAKALINNIGEHEVSDTYFLKPGDTWNDRKNPSYFSTAAFELFKEVDGHEWGRVIDTCYNLLEKTANATSGLVPDWCDESGGDLGTHFSWDAVRTPWRMAWAYAWHGDERAKERSKAMVDWIIDKTGGDPEKIVQGYALNGDEQPSDFPYKVGFTGAFTCAGMVDSSYRQWLDSGYQLTNSQSAADNYYQRTFVVMYLMLLSGNMQNLWEYVGKTEVERETVPVCKFKKGVRIQMIDGRYFLVETSETQQVTLDIHDLQGRRLRRLFNGNLSAGVHRYSVTVNRCGSGVKIISLRNRGLLSKKIMIDYGK